VSWNAAIVIETSFETIQRGEYRSRITPQSVIQSVIAIQAQYRLPVCFARDRQSGEAFVYDFLRHYQNMIAKRYSACCAGDYKKHTITNKSRQMKQEGA